LGTGDGPGGGWARKASTPPAVNQQRQWRMPSAVAPNASAGSALVHPSGDNRIVRARFASSRRCERAEVGNCATCAAVATPPGRPTRVQSLHLMSFASAYQMWRAEGNSG